MNPFAEQSPAAGRGQRGFNSAAEAKAAALAQPETTSFVIMQCKQEFAWISPSDVAMARLPHAMMAGITVVEWGQK